MIHVSVDSGWVTLRFPYCAGAVSKIKADIPGRQRFWDNSTYTWGVSKAWFHTLEAILKRCLPRERWHFSAEAERLLGRGQRPSAPTANTDPYKSLYLIPSAPKQVISAAYYALAKMHHPDIGGSRDTMAAINGAFEIITRGSAS